MPNKPKPFTKGELNLMLEYNLATVVDGVPTPKTDPYDTNKTYYGVNPFSGAKVELNAFTYYVYKYSLQLYRDCAQGLVSVSKYDRMKYLLLKVDADAYMDLID